MLLFNNAVLSALSVHTVGNKTNGEELVVARHGLPVPADELRQRLTTYFLNSFPSSEFYHFTSTNDDFTLNLLYQLATDIFESQKNFHTKTVSMAKHLYEVSLHPQIKAGNLFVAHFTNLQIDGEATEAIGVFKSESKSSVLKITTTTDGNIELDLTDGVNLEKVDKGCLIYNLDQEKGFRLSVIDRAGKSGDAQYWKDLFLRVVAVNNEFQSTKNVLDVARHFVLDQIADEFDVSKADQITYLNKSINYFKKHEEYNKKEFEQEVFEDRELINSFRKFDSSFRKQLDIDSDDGFEISAEAVKKQSRVFKSVLKLDKNFHVYIHGDRELIERGVEKDGRKFYKIYYTREQ
jgi:hypothetical protein